MGKRHLVIPDPHAHPDFHNKRFEWLGKAIADIKPDVVICLGDMADMPSLCTYDMGTKGYEGRRYKKDIEAVHDAQDRMFHHIRKAKRKMPRFVMLEGNHEYRIKRAISVDAAKLEGVISPDDVGYRDYPWDYIEYDGNTPGIEVIDNIAYAHYFTSGIMGRPIHGMHPANALLVKQFMSCTQGHTHTLDFSVRTNAKGDMIMGLVAGVYVDFFAEFAGAANDLWWKGIIVKENVDNGSYDPRFISMDMIKREYK